MIPGENELEIGLILAELYRASQVVINRAVNELVGNWAEDPLVVIAENVRRQP